MLHRKDPEGLVVISQPAHAWVCEQLAEQWGNSQFGRFEPYEEVCLAAEQHDLGWLGWEAQPTLNVETGLPHSFRDMTTTEHMNIWEPAGQLALAFGRYPAMLISMHGTMLYERYHDYSADTDVEANRVRSFVEKGHHFEEDLATSLRADPYFARFATPNSIARNQQLIATWDIISLAILEGIKGSRTIGGVPDADGRHVSLTFVVDENDSSRISVVPWPFGVPQVHLVCEGRCLHETFDVEAEMRAALQRASWVALRFDLHHA